MPEKAGRLRIFESESVLSENYGVPKTAKKIKFPIKNLERVLCLVMPKKRPEDRMKFLRRLVHDNLWVKHGRKPTVGSVFGHDLRAAHLSRKLGGH